MSERSQPRHLAVQGALQNGSTPLSSSEPEAAHRLAVSSQVALQRDFPALPGRLFGRVRSIRSFGERAVFADRPVKMSREHWIGQNGQGEGVRRIIIGHAAPWHETPCRAKSPGRIAQPDRAPAFEAGGCRFKSCCGRQPLKRQSPSPLVRPERGCLHRGRIGVGLARARRLKLSEAR